MEQIDEVNVLLISEQTLTANVSLFGVLSYYSSFFISPIFFLFCHLSWEQRKLGEIFQEYSEKNHPELPTLMIIQGGGTIFRDESDRNLQYDKSSLSNYKIVNEGDFIVHLRSFEGGLEKATNTGIISPAYHTFHGNNIDSTFYYAYFRSFKFINQDLKPHVYGIRDGRSIDINGMKSIRIPWTSLREQKKIGNLINSLDNLITLHQSKAESWKSKKNQLSTISWEQRKLGDCFLPLQNNTLSRADLSDENGVVMNVHYGDVLIKFEECLDVSKERLPFVKPELLSTHPHRIHSGKPIVTNSLARSCRLRFVRL